MNTLESKLLEVILKDLPNQTSGPLRDYMNQAEANKLALDKANKEIENFVSIARKEVEIQKELRGELDKYIKLEREFKDGIVANAKEQLRLQEESVKLQVTLLNKDLNAEQRVTIQQEKFLALLVKNPVSIEYFKENKYNTGSYTNNSDGSTTYHNGGDVGEERTQRIEKTKEE